MRRRTSPAKSPIRKQLVKKIVSYYDTLERDRSASRSRSPIRTSTQITKTKLISNPQEKPKYMVEKNIEYYEGELHRNAKLQKLEDLMKVELQRSINEGALSRDKSDLEHSIAGYPTFMKETEDRLKFKEMQVKDVDQVRFVEFKDSVHQKLKEKVIEAEEDVISVAEDIEDGPVYVREEDDMYDQKLYHLNTKKNYVHPTPAMADHYDFHQRKSKEIRRLQYSAGLGKVKVKAKKIDTVKIIKYPVWVVCAQTPYPANIVVTLPDEEQRSEQLQVTEGDNVTIELDDVPGAPGDTPSGFVLPFLPKHIGGISAIPVPDDGDCDFVALDSDNEIWPHTRQNPEYRGEPIRWPIMITFREIQPYREVEPTNCEVFGPDGESRGRAKFDLLDGENCIIYNKAFMADNNNNLVTVLVKRISDGQVILKEFGRQRIQQNVVVEEILYFEDINVKLTILTLEELENQRLPRQLFFIDGMQCYENIELFTGEDAVAVCTDCNDYRGVVRHDGGSGFMMTLNADEKYKASFVRIVMDDDGKGPGYIDVCDLQTQIQDLIRLRYGGPWVINGAITSTKPLGIDTTTNLQTASFATDAFIQDSQQGNSTIEITETQEVLRTKSKRTPVRKSTSKLSQVSSRKSGGKRSGKKRVTTESRVLGVVNQPSTSIVESTYITKDSTGRVTEETHVVVTSGSKKSSSKKSTVTYSGTAGSGRKRKSQRKNKKVNLTKQQVNNPDNFYSRF